MHDEQTVETYNYATFEGREDFLSFRGIAQVGSTAPDFEVVDSATGSSLRLSDRWRERDLLIEFGSLT